MRFQKIIPYKNPGDGAGGLLAPQVYKSDRMRYYCNSGKFKTLNVFVSLET